MLSTDRMMMAGINNQTDLDINMNTATHRSTFYTLYTVMRRGWQPSLLYTLKMSSRTMFFFILKKIIRRFRWKLRTFGFCIGQTGATARTHILCSMIMDMYTWNIIMHRCRTPQY